MIVQVQLFAAARDQVGKSSVQVEVGERSTAGELRQSLAASFPQLAGIVTRAMLAIDAEYARDDQVLRPHSEIALIPPVSGG
jgi:molybdopterin converting factor subunit 1